MKVIAQNLIERSDKQSKVNQKVLFRYGKDKEVLKE